MEARKLKRRIVLLQIFSFIASIVLVTDGGFDSEDTAIREWNSLLANKNVEILAIGVTGANQGTLSKIGTVPTFSKFVGGSNALTSTFEQIAETLKRKGNNF